MTNLRRITTVFLSALSMAALTQFTAGQAISLDDGRVAQLHDVRPFLSETEPQVAGTRLEDFVRAFVAPPLAGDEDVRALGPDRLVMLARPQQQAWLEKLLADNRDTTPYQVDLTVRILSVPNAAFAEHFAWLLAANDPRQQLQAVRAPGKATDAFLAAVVADPRIDALTAPRLLAAPLRRASIEVGETISYVKDYEVEVVGPQVMVDPVVAEVFDGIRIEMTSARISENRLAVIFDYHMTDLREMAKVGTTIDGVADGVTVELPTWTETHLAQEMVLPDGGTAVVSAPDEAGYSVALVTARTWRLDVERRPRAR